MRARVRAGGGGGLPSLRMRCCESSVCRRRVGRLAVALCRAAGGADADGRRERFRRERGCWAPIRVQDPSKSRGSIKGKKKQEKKKETVERSITGTTGNDGWTPRRT